MNSRDEAAKETFRRSTLFLRHHLELQREEKSLDSDIVDLLIKQHPVTVSQTIPPEHTSFEIKKKIFKSSISIEQAVKTVFQVVVLHIKIKKSPKQQLSEYFDFLNKDSAEAIDNDLIISSFFIRNRAVLNLFGEKTATEVEMISIDIIEDLIGKSAMLKYAEFIDGWGKCLENLIIPHLYISQNIIKDISDRIDIEYSENPLLEHGISDIIINAGVGAWLRVFNESRLI